MSNKTSAIKKTNIIVDTNASPSAYGWCFQVGAGITEHQAALSQDVEHKLDFQTYQQGLDSALIEKRIQLQR